MFAFHEFSGCKLVMDFKIFMRVFFRHGWKSLFGVKFTQFYGSINLNTSEKCCVNRSACFLLPWIGKFMFNKMNACLPCYKTNFHANLALNKSSVWILFRSHLKVSRFAKINFCASRWSLLLLTLYWHGKI